ncbi:hypothetical protein ACVWXN_010879 [Bradyrhizobium sp. i1.4.4]
MPEGLTQTKTPTSKTPAGFKSECRPVSFRNGGRLQIGTMAGFKSEYPAEINRNPQSVANHLAVSADDAAGPPLRQTHDGLQVRDGFALGDGPYH